MAPCARTSAQTASPSSAAATTVAAAPMPCTSCLSWMLSRPPAATASVKSAENFWLVSSDSNVAASTWCAEGPGGLLQRGAQVTTRRLREAGSRCCCCCRSASVSLKTSTWRVRLNALTTQLSYTTSTTCRSARAAGVQPASGRTWHETTEGCCTRCCSMPVITRLMIQLLARSSKA
jgi:hypothetical protein